MFFGGFLTSPTPPPLPPPPRGEYHSAGHGKKMPREPPNLFSVAKFRDPPKWRFLLSEDGCLAFLFARGGGKQVLPSLFVLPHCCESGPPRRPSIKSFCKFPPHVFFFWAPSIFFFLTDFGVSIPPPPGGLLLPHFGPFQPPAYFFLSFCLN